MRLVVSLSLKLALAAMLCLAAAVAWVVWDTNAMLRQETVGSANRVARQYALSTRLGSGAMSQTYELLDSARQTSWLSSVVGPGVCVEFSQDGRPLRRACSGWDGLGKTAPAWFSTLFGRLFDLGPPVRRETPLGSGGFGQIVATADPVAAATRAWNQVKVLTGLAAAMASAMWLLSVLTVGHALLPARRILAGLRRLEGGDLESRLPAFRNAEFDRVAGAFNDLAGRLAATDAERAALTRRLFAVQEEERRLIARELHDEFGQCLTASGALAASIVAGAGPDRPDLAEDARAIARIGKQMMGGLRDALSRLRPPDLDDLGLEGCLVDLVGRWNAFAGARATVHLTVAGDTSAISGETALHVYRIAQEGITNAARHGAPGRRRVDLSLVAGPGGRVDLVVADDGGGDPDRFAAGSPSREGAGFGTGSGFGILGIRERLAVIGGSLTIEKAGAGVRVTASIPALDDPAAAPAAFALGGLPLGAARSETVVLASARHPVPATARRATSNSARHGAPSEEAPA